MTDLTGIGIGRGIAHGPVARMAAPPEPPQDVPSQLTPEEESQRVAEAVQAVAEELAAKGEQAGGQAQDVLEAQAMMAQDPTLADAVAERT